MKPWAKSFYLSSAWKKCRRSYIQSVFGMCERCNRPGKIVHHKVYLTQMNINDPSVSLNHEHLELLCQDCHNDEHHGSESISDGLRFDEHGDVVSV